MLEHWLIELIGRFSGFSHAQLKQIEKSLPATKALDLSYQLENAGFQVRRRIGSNFHQIVIRDFAKP